MIKFRTYITLQIIYFLIYIIVPERASAQELLSLQQVIEMALKNNYSILIAKNDSAIAAKRFNPGNAGFLPKIDITSQQNYSQSNINQVLSSGTITDKSGVQSSNLNAGIILNWTVFDGFAMFINYDKLKEHKNVSSCIMKNEIDSAVASIIEIYAKVTLQQNIVHLFNESVGFSDERLKFISDKFELGSASKLDVLQAKVDLNEDKAGLLEQVSALKNLKIQLNKVIIRNLSDDFRTNDSMDINTNLNREILFNSLAINNADLCVARTNALIAAKNTELTNSKYYPKIGLFSGYNYSSTESGAGFMRKNSNNGLNYGLSLSFNIFDGFNTNQENEVNRLYEESSNYTLQNLKISIEGYFLQLFNNYQKYLELVALEESNNEVAKENLDLALERYKIGNYSSLELRQAQKNYIASQSRLISAKFDVKMTEKELLRICGLMTVR
ncbi:MAG: TolC family protein [Ignavibacteria bacterium]|nr:TolC family protein [Ignavibacteria bacterium]